MKLKTLTYYLVILLGIIFSGSGILSAESHNAINNSKRSFSRDAIEHINNVMVSDYYDNGSSEKTRTVEIGSTPLINDYSDFTPESIFVNGHGSAQLENSFKQNIGLTAILQI